MLVNLVGMPRECTQEYLYRLNAGRPKGFLRAQITVQALGP